MNLLPFWNKQCPLLAPTDEKYQAIDGDMERAEDCQRVPKCERGLERVRSLLQLLVEGYL